MTAPALPADVWVPVPLRWRHVRPGDVIVGTDGGLYVVRAADLDPRGMLARVEVTRDGYEIHARGADPDEPVTVLMRADERDAANLLRTELGAQLIERRTP